MFDRYLLTLGSTRHDHAGPGRDRLIGAAFFVGSRAVIVCARVHCAWTRAPTTPASSRRALPRGVGLCKLLELCLPWSAGLRRELMIVEHLYG